MLDRVKLVRALHTISTSMFKDMTHSYEQAREIWHLMSKDEAFCNQVRHVPYQGMPWWSGLCDEAFLLPKTLIHTK